MRVYTKSKELAAIEDAFSAAHQSAVKRPELSAKAQAAMKALGDLYDALSAFEVQDERRRQEQERAKRRERMGG